MLNSLTENPLRARQLDTFQRLRTVAALANAHAEVAIDEADLRDVLDLADQTLFPAPLQATAPVL